MKKLLLLLFIIAAFSARGQMCIPNTSSMEFDGVSSYVSFPASSALDISDVITIEAWINSNQWGFSSAQNSIVCKHGWYWGEEGFVLRAGGNGELSFNISGQDSIIQWREVVSSPNSLQLNTWYHVAGTFDGNQLKIYINGNPAGTTLFTGTIVPSIDYNVKIGKLADDDQFETRYWSGLIDEVRIWHRALSQSEIMLNMDKHIDPSSAVDLVAYWRLNDASGTGVADLSNSNISGTVNSATWSTDVPFSDGPPVPTITPGGPYLYSSSPVNNQWNFNGVPMPGQTGISIVPTQNGSYTVTVTDSTGCSVTSAPYVATTLSTGDLQGKNPVKIQTLSGGVLHITAPGEVLARASIKIYDVKGRLIVEKIAGEMNDNLDLRDLSEGVYVVSVLIDNNYYRTKIIL